MPRAQTRAIDGHNPPPEEGLPYEGRTESFSSDMAKTTASG